MGWFNDKKELISQELVEPYIPITPIPWNAHFERLPSMRRGRNDSISSMCSTMRRGRRNLRLTVSRDSLPISS